MLRKELWFGDDFLRCTLQAYQVATTRDPTSTKYKHCATDKVGDQDYGPLR